MNIVTRRFSIDSCRRQICAASFMSSQMDAPGTYDRFASNATRAFSSSSCITLFHPDSTRASQYTRTREVSHADSLVACPDQYKYFPPLPSGNGRLALCCGRRSSCAWYLSYRGGKLSSMRHCLYHIIGIDSTRKHPRAAMMYRDRRVKNECTLGERRRRCGAAGRALASRQRGSIRM